MSSSNRYIYIYMSGFGRICAIHEIKIECTYIIDKINNNPEVSMGH